MKTPNDKYIEVLIERYGEEYRNLITDALKFLNEHEPKWNLRTPINRNKYIKGLIDKTKK